MLIWLKVYWAKYNLILKFKTNNVIMYSKQTHKTAIVTLCNSLDMIIERQLPGKLWDYTNHECRNQQLAVVTITTLSWYIYRLLGIFGLRGLVMMVQIGSKVLQLSFVCAARITILCIHINI